ncbi:BON domain-containing protein [Noviherbaspirillum humi]|uniref:BON domain-containing protein n=1 Tax=Noviherbaspirillum humi TaxID=1688639 RepID=A0A239IIS7_9BURK|nr:BON domain-containing protein [Noviherbaspirillum humi]
MSHPQSDNWPPRQSCSRFLSELFDRRREPPSLLKGSGAGFTASARPDAQIEQDLKDELRLEPSVRTIAIDVRVKDGVATSTGPIDSDGEQRRIETAVQRIAGVKSLSTKLQVIVPEPGVRTDDDIARECEDVLATLVPRFDYAIQVMVSNGWVTLSGASPGATSAGLQKRWSAICPTSAESTVK